MKYKWMEPGTDWMTEPIKHYWFKDRVFSNGTIATNESIADAPELYDMENAVEVEHIAISENYESDFYALPGGGVAVTDLCGIVQYIGDDLKDAENWLGVAAVMM